MKGKILVGILFFLFPCIVQAQQEEFKQFLEEISRNMQSADTAYRREFRVFRDSIAKEFTNFRDSINREFAEFLKQPWNTFPIIPPDRIPRHGYGHPTDRHAMARNTLTENHKKDFFGIEINISLPRKIPTEVTEMSEKAVGETWRTLGELDFSTCMAECLLLSIHGNLNTWGYYQLLVYLTKRLPVSPDMRTIAQCFLMNHGGYKCRIGAVNNQNLVLLVPFNAKIYDLCHVLIEGIPYYIPGEKDISVNKLKTYAKEITFAMRIPDIFLHTPLKLGQSQLTYKEFSFKEKKIIIPVNENLIDFYATYPTCDLRVYASASMDSLSLSPLREALTKDASGYTNTHEILQFIHANFKNQPDSISWGRERYFFAEESLYFPYLDCEDSAILFRHLVNQLTPQEAILVVYSEHVAAAVDLPGTGTEKYVLYRDKKYMICEPSYTGASPGVQIPRMEGMKELFCY